MAERIASEKQTNCLPESTAANETQPSRELTAAADACQTETLEAETIKVKPRRRHGVAKDTRDEPIKCLTYRDPFANVYKKYAFLTC